MITSFTITNFKCFREQRFDFEPINLFIGPNGSGKSTILQALGMLKGFLEPHIGEYIKRQGWRYTELPNIRGKNKVIQWEVLFSFKTDDGIEVFKYYIRLAPRRYLGIGKESLEKINGEVAIKLIDRKGAEVRLYNEVTGENEQVKLINRSSSVMAGLETKAEKKKYPGIFKVKEWIDGINTYLLWYPEELKKASRGLTRDLGPSGQYLASVVGWLEKNQPEDFDNLKKELKRFYPELRDIFTISSKFGWRYLYSREGREREFKFSSQQVSDGFLRILAIATFLYLPNPPTLLALEEPENGVHPQLLREIITLIRSIAYRRKPYPTQVFLTSHSPYVLDEFLDHLEEVYILNRKGMDIKPRKLSDIKKIDLAKEVFSNSLGELWYQGVIGGSAK